MPNHFYRVLAVASPILILVLMSLPGNTLDAAARWLSALLHLETQLRPTKWAYTDKLTHILLFLVFALSWVRAGFFPRCYWLWLIPLMLAYAGLTELVQFYVPRRVPDFNDFLADSVGIALGAAWARLPAWRRRSG